MKQIINFALNLLVACALLGVTGCSNDSTTEWTPLLDEDLSQWEMYLSYRLKTGYAGEIPTDEDGEVIQPVGYNNNVSDVYTVRLEDGQPVLRISGEYYGSLFTKQEFENYYLTLQVKWGEKKWEPRLELLRDSGVLYHSIGENGVDFFRSWKLSQEFQVMEGHMGDYWSVSSATIDIRAFLPERRMDPVASVTQPFLSFGANTEVGNFCMRNADYESPHGEWTTLELFSFEDKSVRLVNGELVMVLQNSRYTDGDREVPLTRGRIQLQSEGAEVYYRDIRISPLDALPAEYAGLF